MEENFQLQIISPEKVIFSGDTKMVVLPSYEGDMSILKNHISIITFLRPGIVRVEKKDGNAEEFFAEEGTVSIPLSGSDIDSSSLEYSVSSYELTIGDGTFNGLFSSGSW